MCVCTCPPPPAASSRYDTSLTDAQWTQIEPLLPVANPRHGGRRLKHDRRLILDTILYVLRTGCAWRHVPHDLAPWDAAYRWFRAWTADGTWRQVHEALRDRVRDRDGRDAQPSAAVLDSQSAKSAEGGEAIGYDAGKRVRGRKRHLLVDTGGLVLHRVVHAAGVQDRAGAKLVLTGVHERFPQLGWSGSTAATSTPSTPGRSAGPRTTRASRSWSCRATPTPPAASPKTSTRTSSQPVTQHPLRPSAAGPRFVTVGTRGSTAGEALPGEHRGRAAQRLHCYRTEAARASIGRMSTIPAARDGAAPLRATSDSPGNAAVSPVASPEQIHRQGMVRLAAIIAEWQKARDTLLRGG